MANCLACRRRRWNEVLLMLGREALLRELRDDAIFEGYSKRDGQFLQHVVWPEEGVSIKESLLLLAHLGESFRRANMAGRSYYKADLLPKLAPILLAVTRDVSTMETQCGDDVDSKIAIADDFLQWLKMEASVPDGTLTALVERH